MDGWGSWTKSKGTATGYKALDRGVDSALSPENWMKTTWTSLCYEGAKLKGSAPSIGGCLGPWFCGSRGCHLSQTWVANALWPFLTSTDLELGRPGLLREAGMFPQGGKVEADQVRLRAEHSLWDRTTGSGWAQLILHHRGKEPLPCICGNLSKIWGKWVLMWVKANMGASFED